MSAKELVLISGVNGYIAARVVEAFLAAGVAVRGTVRNIASADGMKKVFAERKLAADFEVVEVKDITVDGAFDAAVRGCHALIHMASPVSQFFTDPEPVLQTALKGTTSILKSATDHGGSTLRSFVLMSSIGAVISPKQPPYTYTEDDWNDRSEKEVARLGKQTDGGNIYRASKALAEKAFWKFGETEKPAFTMTAVNPAYVMGPPLVLPQDPANINETVRSVWTILSGQDIPPPLGGSGAFVDLRDVGRMMVFAVAHSEEANGQRYICCAGVGSEQAVADILNEHYPARRGIMKTGEPGKGYLPGYSFQEGGIRVDASKARKAIGGSYIGFEQTILDSAKAFEVYLEN